ncbi:hypothetical protein EN991_04415 [Mesorhizobium sp. M7A.F.Ca.US.005.03.2.1]|uniref:beta strand repeat-containing protein n=1 Tax=Mesorhizobium sp. M7A.F.Ca.US.005.03.2.1 TaxID=2496737 RepID=UPI000FCBC955|nr:DUF5801 repeats-in-toxin domain-containing protein [Mesorhizobium sp. M7A.F.Ca.US.005.03.2.1]RUY18358.1 hypothetical protein EN991_04415 [Mesorhizobium sp. M7A.F.Ca.US.005.03.2.1]
MALDITTQEIIIDETIGLQDDDVNPSVPPHITNTTLQYLLSLDAPGGLTSPEVAFQANFVVASASAGETITSVVLTQSASGTPFSATVGINSGIRTVDGNYVWLFQDPTDAKVVIGVIGTSDQAAEPAETGPLAFSLALINTSATNADLYTVEYVPLLNPDATNPDDRIDLTNKVFASVTGTSVASFLGSAAAPGNNDFYLINSANDASKQLLVIGLNGGTANVSEQGFGINNQSINPNETLQVDFVTGGNLNAGSASQIQYGGHIETITQAGFTISQITPSTPTARVDVQVSAFNVTNNEQGTDFFDGTATSSVDITGIKLTGTSGYASLITADGTYATGSGNITVTGLTGTGNTVTITGLDNTTTVDVTTSGPMDRLAVKGVDANEGCDISEFHFSATSTNAYSEEVGSFINFDDDGPTLSITAAVTVGPAEVVEASGAGGQSQATITPPTFDAGAVDGYTTDVGYALALAGAAATGLVTTDGNHAITLVVDSATQVSGKYDSDGNSSLDATAFTVTLSGTTVTLTSLVALEHSNAPQGGGEDNTLDLNGLINVVATVTVTDGDADVVSQQSTSSGLSLIFDDTDPTITAPFDADPIAGGIQSPEHLGNAVGQTASGTFGYDMVDKHTAAEYLAGASDFVDTNNTLAGVQINLTGTVDNAQTPGITQAVATLTTETDLSATFNFSFHYDKDPITAGVQDATAGGTLFFDKIADTYTFTLTDAVEGFSFDVLHTSELVNKAPTGNTGHPLIVAEQLTPNGDPDPFFVQFTANSTTNSIKFGFNSTGDGATVGDTTFNNGGATHDMITNLHEDWVSATQATNGVAGDTIQKGEALTLRFFEQNILTDVNPKAPDGGTERLDPTASASGVVIKFDGVGNSEDLVLILDLKDANGNEVTRAVNVQNSDLIKGNANIPSPYSTEFTLDNNDALLILEQNDYTVAGETYQIQGIQIMQSANGLTGTAINLNGGIGASGGSNATSGLTAWDPTDNDVLKIVDIGFVQQTSGTFNANLDFSFALADADGDPTATQHIPVTVSNDYIV